MHSTNNARATVAVCSARSWSDPASFRASPLPVHWRSSTVSSCESGEIDVTTVLNTSAPGQALYQVREVLYEPRYQAQEVIYKSVSFLEAADFAAEFVEDLEPDGVEIERTDGTASETVWTYSKARADANASSREPLAKTFGFDPTLWDGANPRGPVGAARWPTR